MKELRYTTPAGNTKPRKFTINDTDFFGVPQVQGDDLRELFLRLMGDDEGNVKWDDHIKPFFAKVMEPEQMAKFEAFTADQDNIVHLHLLYQIAKDLYEEYAGVPFGGLLASLASRLSDGKNLPEGSPSPEPVSAT